MFEMLMYFCYLTCLPLQKIIGTLYRVESMMTANGSLSFALSA